MKKKLSSAGLKKSLAYVSHYKPLIVLTLTLAVVSTAAALIVPVIIGETIDLIIGKDNVSIAGVVSGLSKAAIIFCIGGTSRLLLMNPDEHGIRAASELIRTVFNLNENRT